MDKMLDRAVQTAAMACAGKERNGEPDILHTLRVMINVYNACGGDLGDPFTQQAMTVAALHDVIEDSIYDADYLLAAGYPRHIVDVVLLLTRPKVEHDYLEYVRKIRDSKNKVALIVKLCDLKDNTDPVRTARMKREEPERYERLQKRYAAAKAVLNGDME